MNLRLLSAVGFVAVLAATFVITEGSAQPNTVQKIVDGVWFVEGDMKQGHSNNSIIEMKDYLVVVDANFPSGARLTMAHAKQLSPKPVRYVFDTHHHGDHAYGNAVWTAAGATTLAYKGVTEEMNRYEPGRWKEAAASRKDVGDLKLNDAERPKQTFDGPKFVLNDGTRELQFLALGWAHTKGDAMAWLPKERVLCSGDAATNGAYNYTADANIGNWPKVMDAALKLDPLYVLPGHGPAGGKEILSGQSAFMSELKKGVAAVVASGKTPDKTNVKLPDGVKSWVGGSLAAQIKDTATEIAAGKAVGALPHK